MGRWAVLAVLATGSGCALPGAAGRSWEPPIVEWRASEQAYTLEPSLEDVVVWADGRIQTSAGKRILLTPAQMDRLFVLLSDVEFLQCDVLDERLRACPVEARMPDIVRDIVLVYSPRPGLRRILRRSWGDGSLEEIAFTPDCYARLEALDRFFRKLVRT
jgi:hypothetical protein